MSQSCRKRANMSDLPAPHGVININEQVARRMAPRVACGLSPKVTHGS
jgi:hypothetical protein